MEQTEILLRELTRLIPPGNDQKHNITFENGALTVCLMLGDKYNAFILDEKDWLKDGLTIANEICNTNIAQIEISKQIPSRCETGA